MEFNLTLSEDELTATVTMEADDTWNDQCIIFALRDFADQLENDMKALGEH